MASLLKKQGALVAQLTETLKRELDEGNFGGGYITKIMIYLSSSAHNQLSKKLISWRTRGRGYNVDDKRFCIFELRTIHALVGVGVLHGLLHDWVFTWVTLNGSIMIFFMGSKEKHIYFYHCTHDMVLEPKRV